MLKYRVVARAIRLLPLLPALLLAGGCPADKEKTEWVYDPGPHWPERQLLPAGGNWLVTSNAYDDTLSFFDADTLAPVATIPIGLSPAELEGPHHVITSPDGQFLYTGIAETVPNSGSGPHGSHGSGAVPGYILKIRASDAALVGSVRVDRSPGDLVLSPDGGTLYVSHFDMLRILEVVQAGGTDDEKRSVIAMIDTESMTVTAQVPVCPAEHGIVLSPNGETLYTSCYGSDRLAVVDVTTPALAHQLVPLGPSPQILPALLQYGPYAATLDPDGKTLWLSCWESGDIRAFNTSSGQMELSRTVSVGGLPGFGGATGDAVYFARQSGEVGLPDDQLVVLSSGGTVTTIHPIDSADCVNAHQAVPDPTAPGKALVACEGDHVSPGSLVRVDAVTGVTEASQVAGVFPDAVTFVAGTRGAFAR